MELYWIWLSSIPSVGPVMQRNLLQRFQTPENVYQADESELAQVPGVGVNLAGRIRSFRSLDAAKMRGEQMQQKKISLLSYDDPLYPARIKHEPNAPLVFYYRGRLKQHDHGICLVGSRRCTEYGKQVAVETAMRLAKHNIPILSGLDKGIQSYAHTACFQANGYSIAFTGGGVDTPYTKEYQRVVERILENGVLLSSHPPGTPLHPRHLYQRNFLLSLWSPQLVVVEAGENSGALNIVDYAKKLNREIWSVPHPIFSPEGRGSNQLIADGARVLLDPCQLYPIEEPTQPSSTLFDSPAISSYSSLHPLEQVVIEKLKAFRASPMPIQTLVEQLKSNHGEIIEALSVLELEGRIRVKLNQTIEFIA